MDSTRALYGISQELWDDLKEVARETGTNLNLLVRMILMEYVDKAQKEMQLTQKHYAKGLPPIFAGRTSPGEPGQDEVHKAPQDTRSPQEIALRHYKGPRQYILKGIQDEFWTQFKEMSEIKGFTLRHLCLVALENYMDSLIDTG